MQSVASASLFLVTLLCLNLARVQAQTGDQQPIVLTASPSCCQSPATMVGHVPQRTVVASVDEMPMTTEAIPLVPTVSTLVPLPASSAWHGIPATTTTVVGYPADVAPVLPGPSVEVLRPAPVATIPEGYVVGRGLIGQPKLYRPGQPVRNFLRYISL